MTKLPKRLELPPDAVGETASTQKPKNIRDLRLSQDFESLAETEQVMTTVTIGKPNRHTFFRVHPEWKACYPILELKNGMKSEFYIVDTRAVPELQDEVAPRLLVPVITRDGRLYVWPLRISNGERKLDQASTSAFAGMQVAKTRWIKLVWNNHSFDAVTAKNELNVPEWPESFDQMLDIAFADKVIDTPEHLVVKSFNGEL